MSKKSSYAYGCMKYFLYLRLTLLIKMVVIAAFHRYIYFIRKVTLIIKKKGI